MNLFEKKEYRMYNGIKADRLYAPICDYWSKQGFSVSRMSPYRIQGETFDSQIGLRRKFAVNVHEHEGNTYMDIEVQAKATDLGLIGGVLVAIICWPIALIGGAVSYSKYDNEASEDLGMFLNYTDYVARAQGGA